VSQNFPSPADVDRIGAVAEPILRNLQITAAYGALSRGFAEWLPGAANWCTFATWASRQAGCSIRKEDLSRLVASRLAARLEKRPLLGRLDLPVERVAEVVGDLSQALPGIDRASDAVARGNLKVFAEIGREFASLLTAIHSPDPEAVQGYLDQLRPGPPPDGQDLVKRAFTAYLAARRSEAATVRAQLTLLGNILIGLHEQTRLQPEILEAMDAAMLDVGDTRRRIVTRLDEVLLGPLRAARGRVGRDLINRIADDIAVELREVVRIITTDRLMTLGFPGDRTFRLGRDVFGSYPADLANIANDELLVLLAEFDITPDSTSRSAAADWSVLKQRLHYIADLFRTYQGDATLLEPPFTSEQLTRIAGGEVPERL
jgi:hypothetical protein